MTKDVQQQGGPFVEQNVFIGLPRQLTVDDTNWRILLHDGVTPGGHEFLSLNELNNLFQAGNAELTGFSEIEPLTFGIVVRTGPGAYIVRTLAFSDEFDTADLSGRNGNPTISLKALLSSDHVFGGAIHFAGTTTSEVPWQGPTEGTHTGPVTGPVTGNVTGNVQGNSEGNHVGGLDARGAEVFFDVNQIPTNAINGLAAALASIPGALPTGSILMWHGDATDIPAGYLLCDGNNGTPDLRDRFVIGAGTLAAHATGGAATTLSAGTIGANGNHIHDVTVDGHQLTIAEMPAHWHGSGVCDTVSGNAFNHGNIAAVPPGNDNVSTGSPAGGYEAKSSTVGGDNAHTHTASLDSTGNHTHSFDASSIDIIPPCYALCYIMKG